jgi:hypothetical protein
MFEKGLMRSCNSIKLAFVSPLRNDSGSENVDTEQGIRAEGVYQLPTIQAQVDLTRHLNHNPSP